MSRKKMIFVFFVLVLFNFSGIGYAGEETTGDYMREIGTKFGRGLWNVVSSPAEIPCTMNSEISERSATGVATGLGKGLAFMLRRILVGVTEVGTFMMPAEATIPSVCHK